MHNFLKHPALLGNLGGPNLPPVALNIPARYQFCVDAGVASAVAFFDDLTAVGLHDHIAMSLHAFMRSAQIAAMAKGEVAQPVVQAWTDAFAAGYLGRIQQELRLFHGDGRRQSQSDSMVATGPSAVH